MLARLALLARLAPGLASVARERPTSTTTVADRLEARAREGREQAAILFEGARWTYGEWNEAANRVAGFVNRRGLRQVLFQFPAHGGKGSLGSDLAAHLAVADSAHAVSEHAQGRVGQILQ